MSAPAAPSTAHDTDVPNRSGATPGTITFVTYNFPSLSETFVLDQIIYLCDEGYDVDVIAHNPGNIGKNHPEVAHYKLIERTSYIFDKPISIPHFIGVYFAGLSWPAKVRLLKHYYAILRNSRSLSGALQRCKMLTGFIHKLRNRPASDLYICHFGLNGDYLARALDCLGHPSHIITIYHGMDLSRQLQRHGDKVYTWSFARIWRAIAVTERWKTLLNDLGMPKPQIDVVRLGVDIPAQAVAADTSDDGVFTFFSVGRLVEKKGHEYAIRALATYLRRPDARHSRLVIAGDGPLRPSLEQLACDLGVRANVLFLGPMSRPEISQWLGQSDAFILVSVTSSDGDMEGLPVSIMEAMAVGLPVVSSYHSGIPELVEHNISGLLAPERDVASIALHMAALAEDPDIVQRIGSEGRKAVSEKHSRAASNARFLDVVKQALGVTVTKDA